MKILVVGAGSIGRRHIRNLNILGCDEIDICDPIKSRLDYIKSFDDIHNTYKNYTDAIQSNTYDFALILTPPSSHIPIATELAKQNIDLFIEKPLSHSLTNIDKLIELRDKNSLIIQVGYQIRYDEGIKKLKKIIEKQSIGKLLYIKAENSGYLPYWRPWQKYTESYSAKKELGGGILLDSSHEIDYVIWLADDKVTSSYGFCDKLGSLNIDVEDTGDILLKFKKGVIANIHLDMISIMGRRECRLTGSEGYAYFNFNTRTYSFTNHDRRIFESGMFPNWEESYIEEMKEFILSIKNRSKPLNNIENSIKVLEIIDGIKKANEG